MVITLVAKPKRANLSLTAEGDNTCCELRIDCSPSPLYYGVLEIGNLHVFANRAVRPLFSKRKSCGLVVYVYRKSELTSECISDIGLSDSKIGALVFDPPDREDWMWRLHSASLRANVHVSDEFFDNIVKALQFGKKAKWLTLAIEKRGVIEPEYSNAVWKLESTTESSCVNVESMEVNITF